MNARLLSALGALAAVAILVLLNRGPATAGEDEVAQPGARSALDGPAAPRALEAPGSRELETPLQPRVRTPTRTEPALADDAEPVLGRGTVLLTVASGAVRTDASGTLTLALRGGSSTEPLELEIEDGRFTFDPELDFEFASIRAGLLDGRAVASLQPFQAFTRGLGDDGVPELDLAVRVLTPVVLEVRDAGTGELVDRVDVVIGGGQGQHPGSSPKLAFDAAPSPIELTQSELERRGISWNYGRWLVGGPGYAWKEVAVNLAGGTNVVMLEPCGSLVVEVSGVGLNEDLHLFLVTEDYETLLEEPVKEDRRFTQERWPTGRTLARIQRGSWTESPKPIAEAEGELEPGETLFLAIEVPAAASALTYELDLAVEVHVPAGWDLESLDLALELVESANGTSSSFRETSAPVAGAASDAPRVFRFDAGPRPTGTWRAAFPQTGWSMSFEHESAGVRRIDHPALAAVTLTVLDRATGERVAGADVGWSPLSGYELGTSAAESPKQPGVFLLRGPAVPLDLEVWHEAYTWHSEVLEPPPGDSELTVELLRPIGLSLQLMDGATNVTPTDWSWMPELRPLGSDDPTAGLIWGQELGKQTLQVSAPGPYVLHLPDLPGYKPIPDREVDLLEGDFLEVVVDVVRGP